MFATRQCGPQEDTQYSAVQCLDTQHAAGDVIILIFGTPYVQRCAHTRLITEWFTAYISDSKVIHKNGNHKQLQTATQTCNSNTRETVLL